MKAFQAAIKDYMSKVSVQGRPLLVVPHARKTSLGRLKCQVHCVSCQMPDGKPCRWSGVAHYNTDTGECHILGQPPEKHAPNDRRKGKVFTAQQLAVAKAKAASQASCQLIWGTLAAAKRPGQVDPPGISHTPPKFKQVKEWLKRYKRKLNLPAQQPQDKEWTAAHFESFRDMLSVKAEAQMKAEHLSIIAEHSRIGDEGTHIVMLCPALLKETLSKLSNPHYVKLSLDGTFRLLYGNYVLLTLGVNTKHWGPSGQLSRCAYLSQFHELGFAIAEKENSDAYAALLQAVLDMSLELGCPLLRSDVRQWHADMHLGIEKARQHLMSHATSVWDWAHVLGKNCQAQSRGAGSYPAEFAGE